MSEGIIEINVVCAKDSICRRKGMRIIGKSEGEKLDGRFWCEICNCNTAEDFFESKTEVKLKQILSLL